LPPARTLPPPAPSAPERRAPLALRLRVAAAQVSLDHAIAAGRPLDSDELELRARQLVSPRSREQIAAGIHHAIARAEEPPARLPRARVLIQRAAVSDARGRLLELASELRSDRPVTARGVARASELISDGASPVFSKHPDGELARHAAAILLTLAPPR
jgi:hypothetical protein